MHSLSDYCLQINQLIHSLSRKERETPINDRCNFQGFYVKD
jgi:hypothetical protein